MTTQRNFYAAFVVTVFEKDTGALVAHHAYKQEKTARDLAAKYRSESEYLAKRGLPSWDVLMTTIESP